MSGLTGTARLTRLAFHRDRVTLSAWVTGLAGFQAGISAMTISAMRTDQDLIQETAMMAGNPAMRMLGLASGASTGGYTVIRGYLTLAILAALMSTLAVVRNTRQAEETGRAELLGATVVGRHASLAAALIVTVCADIVLSALLGLAMIVNGEPVTGSFTAGAAVGAVGVAFAGVAAITAQLSSTTRGANGLAAAAVGVAFLTSGVGNMLGDVDSSGLRVDSAWPAWLSPIGWGAQTRPFGGDVWWPLALFAAFFAVAVAVAVRLSGRRDVGSGLLSERRGPATAGRTLLSPFGLAWRLQRTALLGWVAGTFGFGLILGAISGEINGLEGAALEWYTRVGGTDRIADAYLTAIVQMAGMAVAIYTVQVLLRMRAEEADGPLEPVLSAAVGRHRWVLGNVMNACLGATGLLLVFASGTALTAGRILGDTPGHLRDLIVAGLLQLTAVLVLGGAVLALVGLVPRLAGAASWVLLVAAILLGPVFGPSLAVPDGVREFSPFTHVPKAPAAEITAGPVVVLLAVSLVLAVAGALAFRRRNLALPT